MSITVKQLHPLFVGEVSGVDLAQPLSAADHDAIAAAIDSYAVVVFHDQRLTDDQQIDFARHFGPIHSSAQKARHRARPFDTTQVRDLRRVTTADVASTLEQAA